MGEIVLHDDLLGGEDDRDGQVVHKCQPIIRREYTLPNPQRIKQREILRKQQRHPPKAVEEWINLQLLQPRPYLRLNNLLFNKNLYYHKHFIHFVEFAIDPIFRLVQILDMQLDYVTDSIVEHEETSCLLDGSGGLTTGVGEVEDRGQDLVHTLHVEHLGVELGVDEQYP